MISNAEQPADGSAAKAVREYRCNGVYEPGHSLRLEVLAGNFHNRAVFRPRNLGGEKLHAYVVAFGNWEVKRALRDGDQLTSDAALFPE
ncbi:MAG TPA: hypothetical protein VK976_17960 [Verrucomicrobiae bacterium]|jgi:hypothetical protein|nr:hypothetical protein [Verrucomicrobiae bacterium]